MAKTTAKTTHEHSHDHDHDHDHHDHSGHNHTHAHTTHPAIGDNTILKLTLAWKEIEPAYQKELQKHAKKVKALGFRQGHVPLKLAEEKLGRENLIEETLQRILPPKVSALLDKEKKVTLAEPEVRPVSIEWEKDWELAVHIAEKPEVKLGNYQKIAKQAKADALKELKAAAKDAKPEDKDKDAAAAGKKEADAITQAQFKALATEIGPVIPELLVKHQTRNELERLSSTLRQLGISAEDYLARRQMNSDQLTQELAAGALGQLQLEFVLQAIADDQKIKPTEAEIATRFESLLGEVKADKKPPLDDQTKNYLTHSITREKTLAFLSSL
jgi:FKBP-type peptidyl-prolyl cis-trans isomerase (trigger factor)